ncbi:MAG: uncharacterized protein JWN04_6909 [Myxococcaceae bacterium]|nr:uncharacterized protein [Myxococcaceae bacterium]
MPPTTSDNEAVLEVQLGTLIADRWCLGRVLGQGGMATVYAATHRNGDRVAIKILKRKFAHIAAIRNRFLVEGWKANAVGHPGALSVRDEGIHEDLPYLVMELLEGESLSTRRRRLGGTLPVAEVMALGHQVLDVLAAAHRNRILHRDIKPDNLLLTTNGSIKVLDFGIAKLQELPEFSEEATCAGVAMGTPAFMAPEQADGRTKEIDPRTDLWAVGATMFNLLSGERVHEGRNPREVMNQAATTLARPLSKVRSGVPPALTEIVDRALSFQRENRYQDAASMQRALELAWSELGIEGSPGRYKLGPPPLGDDDTLPELLEVSFPSEATSDAGARVKPGEDMRTPASMATHALLTSRRAALSAAPSVQVPSAPPRAHPLVRPLVRSLAAAALVAGAILLWEQSMHREQVATTATWVQPHAASAREQITDAARPESEPMATRVTQSISAADQPDGAVAIHRTSTKRPHPATRATPVTRKVVAHEPPTPPASLDVLDATVDEVRGVVVAPSVNPIPDNVDSVLDVY